MIRQNNTNSGRRKRKRILVKIGNTANKYNTGKPLGKWYVESFNGKLRKEFLNREIFYTLKEAQILIEQWRVFHNTVRLHSSLGYKPPAPVTRHVNPDKRCENSLSGL